MRESIRLKKLKLNSLEDVSVKEKKVKKSKKIRTRVPRGSYAERLQQAGIYLSPLIWCTMVISVSIFVAVTLSKSVGNVVGISAGFCLSYYMLTILLNIRSEQRRGKVVPDLPGFIDTLAASLGTGFNMETCIEHATAALPEGVLKKEFRSVVKMLNKSITLDEALDHLVRRIAGQEIISLCVTIRLFYGMGGRVVSPFKRLSGKMRQQQGVLERASRDLVGTRQGFYVILGLSIVVPAALSVTQPDYIMKAFEHEVIKYVMQGAVVAQIVCFVVFKRFTALKV